MDLIIKPTEKCNFKCTFCSSTSLSSDKDSFLELETVFEFLERFPDTRTIIVNGGDPLMVPLNYYWELIKYLDDNNLGTTISLTTNLWPYWVNPDKWIDLFKHPRVGVSTSYQHDGTRLKHDLTPYTEDEFRAVFKLFEEQVGYKLEFITVVTPDNAEDALEAVELAHSLNTVCKLNPLQGSGLSKEYKGVTMGSRDQILKLSDVYELYIEVIKRGWVENEYNTKQVLSKLRGGDTTCPLSRNCSTNIRTLQPDGDYYSCGAFGDDKEYSIDFKQEMKGELIDPLDVIEIQWMKNSCLTCPMFNLCNGCKKTVSDHKRLGLVEEHCFKMKQLAPTLIEAAGMTGTLVPTEYVNESNIIPAFEFK